MNTLYQYILSENVIQTYKKNLWRIREFNEYQHFISRLHLIDKYQAKTSNEVYSTKVDELEKLFDMTPEQAFELATSEDSNGYLDKLKEIANEDIKKYLYFGRIFDDITILNRNDVDIDEKLQGKINDFLHKNRDIVDFMCKTSKNEDLRKYEGTLCVNGIGYMLYLFDDKYILHDIKEAFIDLYRYYLDKVRGHELEERDFVYGLTHCIIDISDFYTRNVNDQIMLFQDVYPIGELYDQTTTVIGKCLSVYTKTGSTLNLSSISSDMLAELLVVYRLRLNDYPSNKWYDQGYAISRAYQELVNRIDPKYGYIRDHKEEDFALDLKKNEHTNILFILYSRL